jgi:ABC-type sugar transport system permease subunit
MRELIDTLVSVVVAVGSVIAIFVALNWIVSQAPKRFAIFATGIGAIVGAFVGAALNSGAWFKGGSLWPIGGAVAGAAVGGLVWARWPPSLHRRRRLADRLRPVIFLAPALLFVGITLVIPTIRTIYLSVRSRRGEEYVGLENYRSIFGDDTLFSLRGLGDIFTSRLFVLAVIVLVAGVGFSIFRAVSRRRAVDLSAPLPALSLTGSATLVLLAALGVLGGIVIWNNVFWVVFVTGFSTAAGLAIAALADRSRGENIAKSLIFMPMAISFVGASVIWRFVYAFTPAGNEQIGLLNAAWVGLGGEPQGWVQNRPWNTMFLIAIMIWIQTGFAMVLLSAAIKGVPTELTEAALVDGATRGQIFWRVTLPQIRTTLAVVVTTLIIVVLKIYDIVKVMTSGRFSTNVIANEMFDVSFTDRDIGRGSALAVLIFVAVVPLMIVNMRRTRRAGGA